MNIIKMFLSIAYNDYKNNINFLRIFKKSWARFKKHGFNGMYIRLENEYKMINHNYKKQNNLILKKFLQNKTSNAKFGYIFHNPFVSIIAVNYNGEKDLEIFLSSIYKQSYKNYELIIIDNNSQDLSLNIINKFEKTIPNLKLITLNKNIGFAKANNIAKQHAKGELLALINVDTKIHEDWLKELVDAISIDPNVAATTSKTLFFSKFADIELLYESEFCINLNILENSLEYKKYFIRKGTKNNNQIHSNNNKIIISLPVQNNPINLKIEFSKKGYPLIIKKGKNKKEFIYIEFSKINLELDFSLNTLKNASYIINNAGSILKNNMPIDRGFKEYDIGQYDNKSYVDAFCGVSVLLRRSALIERNIFISEFFAYYEDSELSDWFIKKGYKILYVPRSIVYHKHSSTSLENSPLWKLLVNRSKEIYLYKKHKNFKKLKNNVNHFEEYYKKDIPKELYSVLKEFSKNLEIKIKKNNCIIEYNSAIGIYNRYWNTKGGGESHALAFAKILQHYSPVYLISESDFSLEELEEYYNINLFNCYKLVENNITSHLTSKFNIFINATYSSNLQSFSKYSYYIVSFPHQDIDKKILKNYYFLYNSKYTLQWVKKYWGNNIKGEIIYPVGLIKNSKIQKIQKDKIILNIGRFFVGEHSKNQHIIAKIFKDINKIYPDWKLILIGSINTNIKKDIEYLNKIKTILKGTNHEIIINAKRETVEKYLKKSYIYIHTTGLGNNPELEPHKFEHFGITVVESLINGCIPLVCNKGGPYELINEMKIGYSFDTYKDLINKLIMLLKEYENDRNNNFKKSLEIQNKMSCFLKQHDFEKKIRELFAKGI